jgi:hypothetical protein
MLWFGRRWFRNGILKKFELNLQNQEKNITEIGEKEVTTTAVRDNFEAYKNTNQTDSF